MPSTCTRSFSPPGGYTPGSPATVTLTCTIDAAAASTYIVEEIYPVGWTVGAISDGGADNGTTVRWFFIDNTNRVLTYEITPPLLEAGPKTFGGTIDTDGPGGFQTAPIGGTMSYDLLIAAPHPADTTVGGLLGNSDFQIQTPEILAYAAAFLAGDGTKFPGITANRTAYVLRAAAIFLANSQSRYADVGTASPVDDPAHPARWQESPDI